MSLIQANVGEQNNPPTAQGIIPRLGRQGDLTLSNLHGRYYEQSLVGNTFRAAVTGVTVSAAFATTYTGLVLINPFGSGVNAGVLRVGYANNTAFPNAAVLGIMKGYSNATQVSVTTPVTPTDSFYRGGYSGTCAAASSATLPVTPVLHKVFASAGTANVNTFSLASTGVVEVDSDLILPPGGFAAFYMSAAGPTTGMFIDIMWEENPA